MTKKLLMLIFCIILLISTISAFEFDNVKVYNPDLKEVVIENTFGLGEDVAKLKLNTPLRFLVPRGYTMVAEFDLSYYLDSNGGLDLIEFYDLKRSNLKVSRNFDYKVKTIETFTYNDQDRICPKGVIDDSKNPLWDINCTWVDNGKILSEDRVVWKDLNEVKLIKGKTYTIGIFTNVQKGDKIEWIPTFYGVEIPEWSVWEESLNAGLLAYYKLDDTSGVVLDSFGTTHGQNNGADRGVAGKINYSFDFETSDPDYVNFTTGDWFIDDFSVSIWGKKESLGTGILWNTGRTQAAWDNVAYMHTGSGTSNGEALVRSGTAQTSAICQNLSATVGGWIHYVLVYNDTSHTIRLYENGVEHCRSNANSNPRDEDSNNMRIGKFVDLDIHKYDGLLDEFGVWNRVLSPDEVVTLYNNGSGITYSESAPVIPNHAPEVYLKSPADNSSNHPLTVTLNVTIQHDDYSNLTNVLFIDASDNSVICTNNSIANNTDVHCNWAGLSYSNDYQWKVNASDSDNVTVSSTWNFSTMDEVDNPPEVNMIFPEDNYLSTSSSINFNCSATDDKLLTNMTIYLDGTLRAGQLSPINNTSYLFPLDSIGEGEHTWFCSAQDNNSQWTNGTSRAFNVSTSSPDIILNSPLNDAFNQPTTVILNITTTDGDADLTNVTFINNDTDAVLCQNNSISNGSVVRCTWSGLTEKEDYQWKVNITDGVFITETSVYNFSIGDFTDPIITPPSNNTLEWKVDSLGVDFNANEVVTWGVNDTTNYQINSSGWLSNKTVFGLGTKTVQVSATDGSSNIGYITFQSIVQDTIVPIVTPPANATLEYKTDSLGVDFSGSETGTWAESSAQTSINQSGWLSNSSVTAVGVYEINVSLTDGSSNVGWKMYKVTVQDTINPTVTIVSPLSQNYTSSSLLFNITSTDLSTVTCDYSINNNVNISMSNAGSSYYHQNTSISNGIYTARFYCEDAEGNLNDTESVQFNVSLPPTSYNWTSELDTSLLAYYRLDGLSGIVSDSSGRGNNGDNDGATRGVTGIINSSFDFERSETDTVIINHSTSMLPSGSEMSVSLWLKPESLAGAMGIFGATKGSSANSSFEISINGGNRTQFSVVNNTNSFNLITSPIIKTGVWTHLVMVFNGTHNLIYTNGSLSNSTLMKGSLNPNALSDFFIGSSYAGTSFYDGLIDEVGLWNRTLNSTEVTMLYNNSNGLGYDADYLTITQLSPSNNYETFNKTNTFICNVSDNNGITNVSLIIDGSIDQTNSSGINNINYSFIKTFTNFDVYTWGCNVYDNENNLATTVNRNINATEWIENSQSYSSSTTSGTNETFTLNFSYDATEFTNVEASLVYNGTSYTGSIEKIGESYIFTRHHIVPSIISQVNLTFYWNINLNNGTDNYYNSTSNIQTIEILGIDDCSVYSNVLYNFSIKDEITQANINPTFYNTTAMLNLQIYDTNGNSLESFNHTYNEINPFAVCIQSNLSGGEEYLLDLQLQYDADNYAQEFYHIQRNTITSDDLNTLINLYDLDDDNSQEFKITYKDESFLPVGDAIIQIQRKYVGESVFKTVEIPKTDTNGETLAHLQLSDVIYTFIIIKNGITLSTFSNVLAYCDNVATGDCEINLNAFSSAAEVQDYTKLDDFSFKINWNKETKTISSNFIVPSGSPTTITLNVTKDDALGTTNVCSDTLTSASGTLSCVVPESFSNSTIVAKIYKGNNLIGYKKVINWQNSGDIFGTSQIFLALFLTLTILGIAITDDPVLTGFFFILGVGLNMILHTTANTGFIGSGATILWFIIAIIIVIIKAGKRR